MNEGLGELRVSQTLFYAFCLHGVSKSDILRIYSSDMDEKRDCLQVELFAYEQNEWI